MISSWTYNGLKFRFMEMDSCPELVSILHDPEVEKYLWFAPITEEAFSAYASPVITEQEEALNNGDYPANALFAIYANGELIGSCGLSQIIDAHNCGLVGYQLKRSAWGRGYATQSLQFLLYYASEYLNYRKLYGDCVTENIASATVLQKCGFVYEATIKERYEFEGMLHDNSWFGLRMCDAEVPSGIQNRE